MYNPLRAQLTSMDKKGRAYERARGLFYRKFRKSIFKWLVAEVTGENRDLLWLGDVEREFHVVSYTEHDGVDVRVSQIRGSHSQSDTYDCDFLPLLSMMEERWVSVASLMLRDVTRMPPVDLVQVGDVYYIVDGHHRQRGRVGDCAALSRRFP